MTSLVRDSFTFPKVRPQQMYLQLLDGELDSLKLKPFVLDATFKKKEKRTVISKNSTGIVEKKGAGGKITTLAQLNQDLYERFLKTGRIDSREDFVCLWCRRRQQNQEPVRIPVHLEKKANQTFVHVMFTTCSYRCALAEVQNRLIRYPHDKNSEESLLLINLLFSRAYPNKTLTPAPDYLLLQSNGGPLSQEEYDQEGYVFQEDKNYFFVPAVKLYALSKSSQTGHS